MKIAMPVGTRVSDIMHPGIITIPATATVVTARAILSESHVQGAPVVDGIGRIIGVLSTTDLTDPRRSTAPDDSVLWVMTRVVFGVREDDPAVVAIHLMVREGIHRVVVVDADGHAVGMITPMDVLRAIDRGVTIHANADDPIAFVRLDGPGTTQTSDDR